MTGPEGNSEFVISMFPETKSMETLRFKGNKIYCSQGTSLYNNNNYYLVQSLFHT